jgi:hypothetical protein
MLNKNQQDFVSLHALVNLKLILEGIVVVGGLLLWLLLWLWLVVVVVVA